VRDKLRVPMIALMAIAAVALGYLLWPDRERTVEAPECEAGPTVAGIDVSYYQESIEWRRVRRAGMRFAFIRVSDGVTVEDPRFAKNWSGAKRAGMLRGAYQHFRPEESATAQADLLVAAIARDPGELPPVIDVEVDGGKSPDQVADRVRTWVARVRSQLGVEPIIYTGPEFWRERVGGADLSSQPLWVAHYTRNCPTVPPPWTTWTFWQHTDSGQVPGIEGPVDLDVFAGTLDDLEDLARRSRLR
jgi:lysozyme